MTVGDRVIMNGNYYVPERNRGKVFTVRSRPFAVSGTLCVLLDGYPGGYAADGLSVVVKQEAIRLADKKDKETL